MSKEVFEREIPRDAIAPLEGDCFEIKLSSIARVQNKPFNIENYQPEKPYKYTNEHGKEVNQKFNLLNVVRWRYSDKGTVQPYEESEQVKNLREFIGYQSRYPDRKIESNTRVVEWSDGTHSLVVGDEYFDMTFSKANNTHVYVKAEDLLIQKNKVNKKCIIKPSKNAKRAHKAVLKNVNDKTKQVKSVEKTFIFADDPKIKKKRGGNEPPTKKRVKKEVDKFEVMF